MQFLSPQPTHRIVSKHAASPCAEYKARMSVRRRNREHAADAPVEGLLKHFFTLAQRTARGPVWCRRSDE